MPKKALPDEGFCRLDQVLQVIPVCKSSWIRGVKAGRYPQPIKYGRLCFYRVQDIRRLIEKISKTRQPERELA